MSQNLQVIENFNQISGTTLIVAKGILAIKKLNFLFFH